MELSGPSFVIVKNGRLVNKYELIARVRTPKGIYSTLYYFDSEEDAETYRLYLIQQEGGKDLNKLINSTRTFEWEREEYKKFRDSIDWNELPDKVSKMNFTKEETFVEIRGIK